MEPDLKDQIRGWLAAERPETPDEAERAFRLVFRLVPRYEPLAGFAGRVLARMQPARRFQLVRGFTDARWGRAVTAASLLLTGLAVLVLPQVVPVPSPASVVGTMVTLLGSLVTGLERVVDFGLWVWALLSDIGLAVRAVVTTPPMALILSLNGGLAIASLLGLRRLMARYEESL